MPEITDPADQLHRFCTNLKAQNHATTREALNAVFKTEGDDSVFFTLLGVVNAKFVALENIIPEIENYDPARKKKAIAAVKNLRGSFNTNNFNVNWKSHKETTLKDNDMTLIEYMSPILRVTYKITIPKEKERADIIEKIDDVLQDLMSQSIFSLTLINALKSIRFSLQHLYYLSSDDIMEKIIVTSLILKEEEAYFVKEGVNASSAKNASFKIREALFYLYLSITGPDAALTAIENHYERYKKAIEYISGVADNNKDTNFVLLRPQVALKNEDDDGNATQV